jgi:membrane protease YdiL (CAAX protease family)
MPEQTQSPLPTVRDTSWVMLGTFMLLFAAPQLMTGLSNKLQMLILEVLTVLPVFIFVLRKRAPVAEVFRFRRIHWKVAAASLSVGIGLCVVTDEIDRLVELILPMPEEIRRSLEEVMTAHSVSDFALIVLAAVVVASIAEEMLFRGFLQGALERSMDVTKAVLLSAFIFTLLHFNPWWLIDILVAGVFLGVMSWKSRSLWPCVIVHAVNNGLGILFVHADENRMGWYTLGKHVSPLWVVIGAGLIWAGFQWFYRTIDEGQIKNQADKL